MPGHVRNCGSAAREGPLDEPERVPVSQEAACAILDIARRGIFQKTCSDALAAYALPVPRRRLCSTAAEAVTFAEEIGYPGGRRAASPQIVHKTRPQAVVLNVAMPRKSVSLTPRCSVAVRLASGRRDPRRLIRCMIPAGHEVILRPPPGPAGVAGADVRTGRGST